MEARRLSAIVNIYHECSPPEADPTHLGRWVSHVIEGKGQHTIRYVSAYNPCKSKGNNTVYTQHQEHFRNLKTDREPNKAFQEDLQEALQSWNKAGDKVVLYMDANQDVRRGRNSPRNAQERRLSRTNNNDP